MAFEVWLKGCERKQSPPPSPRKEAMMLVIFWPAPTCWGRRGGQKSRDSPAGPCALSHLSKQRSHRGSRAYSKRRRRFSARFPLCAARTSRRTFTSPFSHIWWRVLLYLKCRADQRDVIEILAERAEKLVHHQPRFSRIRRTNNESIERMFIRATAISVLHRLLLCPRMFIWNRWWQRRGSLHCPSRCVPLELELDPFFGVHKPGAAAMHRLVSPGVKSISSPNLLSV